MSSPRHFDFTTPEGATVRIYGSARIDPATLEALLRVADLVLAQLSRPTAPIEFRADGWPLCPNCGEDELWSALEWPGPDWPSLDERPPMEAWIAAGLSCYKCSWSSERAEHAPQASRTGLITDGADHERLAEGGEHGASDPKS